MSSILKNHIAILLLTLIISCSSKSDKGNKNGVPDRVCDCLKLLDKQERGLYLKFLEGEDTLYTGNCKLTRENGNEITYRYFKGHMLEEIETYPGGILNDAIHYDTTGRLIKRVRYYPNGHKYYEKTFGDHTFETFYENGRLQRKGGYGFTKEDFGNKYHNLDAVR